MSLNNIENIMNITIQIMNIYCISNINRFRTFWELYIGKIWIKTENWLYFLSVNKTCVCYLPGFLVGFESWMDVEKWRWINVTYHRWTNVDATFIQRWINDDATLIQWWINVDARFNQRWIFSIFYSNITSLVLSHSSIFHGREFITTLLAKRCEKGDMVFWHHYKKVG
jgi:hypothetical protein